jgi:hypothetical protein
MEDSKTEVTRANVDQKIDSFVEGGLEHASETIVALLEIASKDDDIGSPVNTSPDVRSTWLFILPGVTLKCFIYASRTHQIPAGRL